MPRRVPVHPSAGLSDYLETLQTSILREPDRVAGILARAYVDAMLEVLLHDHLVKSKAADDLLRNGQFSSFGGRINLAFVLGCLAKPVYHDLQIVRDIGNHFAHELKARSFEEPPVRDWCDNLWGAKRQPAVAGPLPAGAATRRRVLFNTAIVMIALELEQARPKIGSRQVPAAYSDHYLTPNGAD